MTLSDRQISAVLNSDELVFYSNASLQVTNKCAFNVECLADSVICTLGVFTHFEFF